MVDDITNREIYIEMGSEFSNIVAIASIIIFFMLMISLKNLIFIFLIIISTAFLCSAYYRSIENIQRRRERERERERERIDDRRIRFIRHMNEINARNINNSSVITTWSGRMPLNNIHDNVNDMINEMEDKYK